MGLKNEKKKPKFKKGQYVYFKHITYRIEEVKFDNDDDIFIYRLKVPGNIFAFWVDENADTLQSTMITEENELKNFFESLVK